MIIYACVFKTLPALLLILRTFTAKLRSSEAQSFLAVQGFVYGGTAKS